MSHCDTLMKALFPVILTFPLSLPFKQPCPPLTPRPSLPLPLCPPAIPAAVIFHLAQDADVINMSRALRLRRGSAFAGGSGSEVEPSSARVLQPGSQVYAGMRAAAAAADADAAAGSGAAICPPDMIYSEPETDITVKQLYDRLPFENRDGGVWKQVGVEIGMYDNKWVWKQVRMETNGCDDDGGARSERSKTCGYVDGDSAHRSIAHALVSEWGDSCHSY